MLGGVASSGIGELWSIIIYFDYYEKMYDDEYDNDDYHYDYYYY